MNRLVIDDIRVFQFDATYLRDSSAAFDIIISQHWDEVWLDHDMGNQGPDLGVLCNQIESFSQENRLDVDVFMIHTSNPVARLDMFMALSPYYRVELKNATDFVRKG
jgi:hypothetical protein